MKKKRSPIGCLFWLALILLVVIVFLFNRERIKNVLENTGFTNLLTREKEEEPEVVREEEDSAEEEPRDDEMVIEIQPAEEDERESEPEEEREAVENAEEEPSQEEENTAPREENWKIRNGKLYFIEVDENGVISLQAVTRPIKFRDSPLTQTMEELLNGLLPSELNRELITLIPEETEILSVRVENKVAYINVNEAFRFNSLGLEGYIAQLKQIVYTATEFPTVNSVQILIEGKSYEYLGPEGVFIGKPLSRSSFN
jgi:spore germination protein GerM